MSTDARSTSRDRLRAMPCQKEENERSEVKSTKTIRMSLSREQPPARVERAQQEQDFTAQKHAPFRLWRLGKQHVSAFACGRLCQPPAPGTRAVGCSCSAASENADFSRRVSRRTTRQSKTAISTFCGKKVQRSLAGEDRGCPRSAASDNAAV